MTILSLFVGLIITYVALGALSADADKSVMRFLIPYILGTVLLISSLFFMVGPKKQWERAFDKDHRITSIIVLVFMGLTILCCIVKWHVPMVICLIIQLTAFIWYCIMMIPGARKCCCFCVNRVKGLASDAE